MTLEQIDKFLDVVAKQQRSHEVTYGVEHQRNMPDDVKEHYLKQNILDNLVILLDEDGKWVSNAGPVEVQDG